MQNSSAKPATKKGQLALVLGLIAAVISGLGVAIQSKINGQLGEALDDAVLTSLFSFSSGWILCIAVFFLSRNHARQSLKRLFRGLCSGELPWWALIGGFAGAFLVFFQSSLVNTIGLAGFTISLVAGSTVGGMVMDVFGVSGITRKLNFLRGLGATITLGAVILMVSGQLQGNDQWWLLILPFFAGMVTTFQQATIGLVRHETKSFTLATLVSFSAGTVLIFLIWLALLPSQGLPQSWPSEPLLYLGGMLGFIFILTIAIVVRRIGVLLLTLTMTAGQLIGSLVIDLYYPDAYPITALSYLAIALAMVGVTTAALGLRSSKVKKKKVRPEAQL
ncbi:MAG: DMT family transporter [Microbacteriaceae bacterium]